MSQSQGGRHARQGPSDSCSEMGRLPGFLGTAVICCVPQPACGDVFGLLGTVSSFSETQFPYCEMKTIATPSCSQPSYWNNCVETKAKSLSAVPQLDSCFIRQGVATRRFSGDSSRDRIWGYNENGAERACLLGTSQMSHYPEAFCGVAAHTPARVCAARQLSMVPAALSSGFG